MVTGAGGFVGRMLCPAIVGRGWTLDAVSRHEPVSGARHTYTSLAAARAQLEGVDVVIHLAGLAHGRASVAGRRALMQANVEETTLFYAAACDAGVNRFVHVSSVRVLGDSTCLPWSTTAPLDPRDAYAESKARAEQELCAIAGSASTALVIVRPPLVYGPGVKANFLSLLRWARRGWPLPLQAADAPRAWLSVRNLVDFLVRVVECGVTPRETDPVDSAPLVLHVADREETSVADMLGELRHAMGRPPRLWRFSPELALRLGHLVGMRRVVDRLFKPVRIESTDSQLRLEWSPPQSQRDAIEETVDWFLAQS
jgi:UDP-glucose 4-epimerase